jgi:flagellar assembly protein FliH
MSSSEAVAGLAAGAAAVRPFAFPALVPQGGGRGAAAGAVREGQRIALAVVARAEAQAREIEAAAREEGLARGRAEARETEGPALQAAAAALAQAARELAAEQAGLRRRLEADLPGLVVALAGRILRRELALQPELLARLLRDAVAAVVPAARVRLLVHPEDLGCLERHRELIAEALAGAELHLEPCEEVGRAGCLVETDALSLAAGLPQLLERALALLGGEGEPAPGGAP